MQNKLITQIGKWIILAVILSSISPGCLVKSGPAPPPITTLNLVQANIVTTGGSASSASPSSNSNFGKCDGENFKDNTDFAILFNGDKAADTGNCICGR